MSLGVTRHKALPRRNPPSGRGVGGGAVHTYLGAGFEFCGATYSQLQSWPEWDPAPEQGLWAGVTLEDGIRGMERLQRLESHV